MPLGNPSPLCTVNASSTLNGVNVAAATTYTIALADTASVGAWTIRCLSTDDLLVAATISLGLTIDSIAKTATGTAPALGSALIFQSQVNGGKDPNGQPNPALTCTFAIFVLTSSGNRVAAFNEIAEGNAAFGWVAKWNDVARNTLITPASAGAGLTYGSGAYSIGQNADGSIVVNADDIQLRASYQTLLNGATSAATVSALAQRDGSGNCAFAAITVDSVVANGKSWFVGNTAIGTSGSGPFADGTGVLGIANASGAPSTNPTGGGCLYAVSGALKWKGSSGTVTTIAPA